MHCLPAFPKIQTPRRNKNEMSQRKRDSALGAVVTLLGAGISARWAFGAMPKAHARPAGRRGADRSQVRLDGFLSPRGGVTRPHRASVGTPSSISAFVRCPACGADVAMRLLNDHLDSGKCASVSTARGDERRDERRRDGDGDKSRVADTASAHHLSSGDPTNAWNARRTIATDAWTVLMRHDARREEKRKTLTSERASAGKDPLRLPGHFVIEDFVTVAEETALVKFLDDEKRSGARWKLSGFNGKHLGKKWGVEVDLKRRTVKTENVRPMPPELLKVAARLRAIAASELDTSSDTNSSDDVEKGRKKGVKKMPRAVASAVAGFAPNEANAIDYRRLSGMELRPHCDDRQMSSGVLVNLSLLGDCVMTYARDAKRKQKATRTSLPDVLSREDENETRSEETAVDVFLPRRSLQVQTGETRYDFSHAIRNENLLADRRVSVTFRESAPPAARRKAR